MAILFQEEFKSLQDARYRISIDDATLGSDANLSFDLAPGIFTLSYDGQNDNRFQSVITSRVTLSMMINSTFGEDFIEDCINSVDGRFKLKIEKFTSDWALFWVGNIITDQVSYEDQSYPFQFNITAIDQLGTLSEINYNDDGTTYTGEGTVIDHILNCLGKTDLDYFHSGTDGFLTTVNSWYDTNHFYSAVNKSDPLLLTRINHIAFYREDDEGVITYFNCLFVLQELAKTFGARIYQSGGAIRFEQLNERAGSDYYEFVYNNTGVQQSEGIVSADNVTTDKTKPKTHLAGGVYDFLPGLKYVKLNYNHESNRNLLLGATWDSNSNNQVDVGEIESDQTTSTFKFTANLYIKVITTASVSDQYRFDFRLKLKHGTKTFKRLITDNGFGTLVYSTPEWTDLAQEYYITTEWIGGAQVINIPITFETPVIPLAVEDLLFDFNYNSIQKISGAITGTPPIEVEYWELQTPFLEFYSEGTPDTKNVRTFQVNNDFFVGNTQTKTMDSFFGDAITNVTRGKLQVYNGSDWEDSTAWSINQSGTTYSIMELLIFEILAGQKRGTMRYNGTFQILNFAFHQRIIYSSDNFLMLAGSFSAGNDTWNGSFFKLVPDRNNMTFATEIDTGSSAGGGLSGSGGSSTSGGSTTVYIPPTPEYFINVIGQSITGITGTLPPGTLADQYMALYRDGRKLRYSTHFTINETDNEIDLNLQAMGEDFELIIYS